MSTLRTEAFDDLFPCRKGQNLSA